jgi:hypothetical protein
MRRMKSSNLGSVHRIIIILIRKTSSFQNIGFSHFRFSFVSFLVIRSARISTLKSSSVRELILLTRIGHRRDRCNPGLPELLDFQISHP